MLMSIIAAPAVLLLAVIIIAVPVELSVGNYLAALRASVAGYAKCHTDEVRPPNVVGRVVAGTADRLFSLRADGHVMPIRLDDVRSLTPPASQ